MSNPITDGDYTYAERFGDFDSESALGTSGGRTNKYATPIDEATAAEVVSELTSDADYLEALSDKFSGDAEFLAGVGGALAVDSTYLEGVADYLATDAEFLAGVSGSVFDAMTTDYYQPVAGEIIHVGPTDALTVTVGSVDAGGSVFAKLGDNGIKPTSVSITITANDDDETLAVTDTDNGDGTGALAGTGVGINATGTITYATGAWSITADGELKQDEDILASYEFIRDGLYEGRSPLSSATITAAAEAADEIDVTIQLQDADGENWNERTMVSVWWCSDADATVPAGPTGVGDITTEGTAGGILETLTATMSFQCVTDEAGSLVLTLADDDATDDLTSYLGVMLPNGKYVVSGAIVFNLT